MILSHFTEAPFVLDPARKYVQKIAWKPTGLWLSDEESEDPWSSWCIAERFYVESLTYCTQVEVDIQNILIISMNKELIDFTNKYASDEYMSIYIDWLAVEKVYSGIIITPYLHMCRDINYTMWYYPWEGASGAIWNLDCVRVLQ
jgi:hypothetical protein